MAAKRNYRQEEQRRNELARSRGFTSRASQRKAIETGRTRALQPHRIQSPTTRKAQLKFLAEPKIVSGLDLETRAQDWSDLNGYDEMAQYLPERALELGVTRARYRRAYIDAWVTGFDRYKITRHQGGSPALHYWLVELNEFMSESEYQRRYGKGK